jgi:hypothetical protein
VATPAVTVDHMLILDNGKVSRLDEWPGILSPIASVGKAKTSRIECGHTDLTHSSLIGFDASPELLVRLVAAMGFEVNADQDRIVCKWPAICIGGSWGSELRSAVGHCDVF